MFIFFNKVKDPVCGMKINKKEAKFSSPYEGRTYYFCSENCKQKFDSEPKKYTGEVGHSGDCCH